MECIKIKPVNDQLKRCNIYLLIIVVIIGISFGIGIVGYLEFNKDIDFTYFNDVILMKKNRELKNAYLEVHQTPYVFAGYENDSTKFYIVQDENYIYIVYLTEELYNAIMSKDLEKDFYRIEGYTETIPEDVKILAIEAYNEIVKEETITLENFDSYFGTVYLNTTGVYNNVILWCFFALFVAIFGFLGFISLINYKKKMKNALLKVNNNDLKKLSTELKKEDIKILKKGKLYLTKTYILSLFNNIDIIKYKDIIWFYKQEHLINGITIKQSVVVVTKDKVKHTLINVCTNKKINLIFEEIMNELITKTPKVLIGFTEENRKKVDKLKTNEGSKFDCYEE